MSTLKIAAVFADKAEAEKVGGSVWVESQVDVGTTFVADLPLVIKTKKL